MDFLKKSIFILLFSLCGTLLVQASTPGFNIKVAKSWTSDSISFTQFDGEIENASKLKINNWYIEIPYNKNVNNLHGNWGCEIEVRDDKIVLTGGETNQVIKVFTTASFGFIVSNPGSNFDVENAVLYTKNKEIPNHTDPEDSEDDSDMNVGLPYEDNRYFPESMDIAKLKAAATAMSVSEVKAVIFKELNEHWDVISKYLMTDDMLKVYALFLGWATRESTLNAGVETAHEDGFGVNSAHAYGPFQTAVTAFYGCDPTFDQEDDVTELYWYTLNEKNFCDPYISTHMGIRKLIHFVKEAESFGSTGINIIRSALKGFNSGHATPMQENETFHGYCDEIGSLGHWYYETRHFDDDVYTWTGDDRADRTDAWSWWEKDPSITDVKMVVRVRNPEDGTTATYSTGAYPTATTSPSTTTLIEITPTSDSGECWAKALGYSCCKGCDVIYSDNDGDWSIENDEWCGIIDKKCNGSGNDSKCFSEEKNMGYPCCDNCEVITTDSDGGWGIKNNNWCGIPYKCYN